MRTHTRDLYTLKCKAVLALDGSAMVNSVRLDRPTKSKVLHGGRLSYRLLLKVKC